MFCDSAGPDEIYPGVLQGLAETIPEWLEIIFQSSQMSKVESEARGRVNIKALFKWGEENENRGDYGTVKLTSMPQMFLELAVTSTQRIRS